MAQLKLRPTPDWRLRLIAVGRNFSSAQAASDNHENTTAPKAKQMRAFAVAIVKSSVPRGE